MLAPAPAALTRISAASTGARYSGPVRAARVQIQDWGDAERAIESCQRPYRKCAAARQGSQPSPCWPLPPAGIWVRVNQQDRQAIDDLFQHLNQSAAQAGPRDQEAEARIRQHVQAGPPGLLYEMAQRLVGQQAALRQLRAQLDQCQQQLRQGGSRAGFAQPGWRRAPQQDYGDYGPPPYQQRSGGQGFLAGAGQIALGVGGGILAAEAIGSLLGGGGLFGDGGDEYVEQNVYVDQDDAGQGYDDGGRDSDDGGQDGNDSGDGGYDDDGGDFDDGGGFDGGDW